MNEEKIFRKPKTEVSAKMNEGSDENLDKQSIRNTERDPLFDFIVLQVVFA